MTISWNITKETRIAAIVDAGPVIEISFKGKHRDGCGNELLDYVRHTVAELSPAGVVMNLLGFEYKWGNDIGAMLFPLLSRQTSKPSAFCIAASGRTALSLKSLFELTRIPDLVNARYFGDAQEGLEYLLKMLRSDTT